MRYKVTHTTSYLYSDPVPVCHNRLLLTPRENTRTACLSYRLQIKPHPTTAVRRQDYFGNLMHVFSIEESHRKLVVTSTSRVVVRPAPDFAQLDSPPWEQVVAGVAERRDPDWFTTCEFTFDSPKVQRGPEFAEYARASFTPQRPVLQALEDFTRRIHTDFEYDRTATNVGTTAAEAFALRRGVCQDLTHVEIACLKSLGLPARYVSGYLRTIPPPGKPRLIGADQSHAWLSVHCGPLGWVDVDPTNARFCDTDHITIAVGREYSDVCPIKGVFLGGGTHAMTISVDVHPLDRDVPE